MPPRLTEASVRQIFYDAGYELPDNFVYTNTKTKYDVIDKFTNQRVRLSLQQLKYKIAHDQRPTFQDFPLNPQVQEEHEVLDPFERFRRYRDPVLMYDEDVQRSIFNIYKDLMNKINRKQTFTYNFSDNITQHQQIIAVIYALSDSIHKVNRTHEIRLELTTNDDRKRFIFVNIATINALYEIFETAEPNFEIQDSADNMLFDEMNYKSLTFHYSPVNHNYRRVRAGFFPFINENKDVDLSKYGIYNSADDERILEPCIITAFKSSNLFSENEINQLSDMIKVNNFPQSELKNISKLFNINIYVRHYKEDNTSSHIEVKQETAPRTLKLMILYNHFMLYENENKRSNYALINKMIKDKQLRPMTDKEIESIVKRGFTQTRKPHKYSNRRLIVVPDEKFKPYIKYNQYLFGYEPEANEIDDRLNELQTFVDSLNLRHRVIVRHYKRFSTLMNKIMFEFGCFDGVYELTGSERDEIRDSLIFPKREMTTSEINEKCYYIDFNGAFCSFMTHIPCFARTSSPSGINNQRVNTKINELIHKMYDARLQAKRSGNIKFAKTLKFIMCSCYGSSIKRPKLYKHKYTNDIDKLIKEYGDLVISHNDKGFATIKNSYVEHYSHPQFAKVILDGFNDKCNEIKGLVNVLFQNFDAFVVNESDFNKLNELGYIHPYELGKLKVEHVFTSMKFKNKNQWIGVNEDGTIFNHGLAGI